MGIAAVAMAASMFAADVAAGVGLSSTLFSAQDGKVTVLEGLGNTKNADYATLFSLQASVDKAGGGVKYWGGKVSDADVVKFGAVNVWFKPVDALKLSFMENGLGLFGDKYNGYEANSVISNPGSGYGVQYAMDALTFDVVLEPTFVKDNKVGAFGTKVSYNADFGSIAAIFGAANNFDTIKVAAGYSNNFDGVGVVANVGFEKAAKNTIKATVSAGGNVDALGWAIVVPFAYTDKASVGTSVSVSYALDACTAKAYFSCGNFMADTFDANIGVDFTGNVGGASWKVAPAYGIKDKKFSVGFETGIGF